MAPTDSKHEGARSLRSSVAAALGHSADGRKAQANLAAAATDTKIAYAGYQPTIQSGVGVGTDDTYDVSVTVSQPLFDWGRTHQEVGKAKALQSAASSRLSATWEADALNAAKAHIDLKRTEELVALAEKNVTVHERFTALAKDRTEGGVGDATEIELAGVHEATAESTQEQVRGALLDARSTYISRTGVQPDNLAPVPELALSLPQGSDFEAATDEAPTVKSARAEGQAARHAVKSERKGLLPTLSAEAFARRDENDNETETGIGLRLRGPTLVGLSSFSKVEAARLRAESATWAAESARREVRLQVHELFDREPILRKRIGILSQQLKKARALRDLYEDQFKIGQRKLADLVNVQADVFRFERELVEAHAKIRELQYSAAASLGTLVETLGLKSGGGME
ncbi:TolC family protein [Nitratireductor sp. GCM10026969]|uniref:TolC family protein n=1 Tax=Nitratireductor sp. GCM10026969 TaxID=3252645 RepID=UPI003612F21A